MIHLSLDLRLTPVAQRQGTVTYPLPGSPDTWTLPAALYPDLYTLAEALQSAVRTAQGGDTDWTVSLSDAGASGVILAHAGDTFGATFPAVLQTHVGWAASYASTTAASPSSASAGWWPTLPYGEPADVTYHWRRHFDPGDADTTPLTTFRALESRWRGTLPYELENVTQLRIVLPHLLRGRQFRLWPAQTYNANPWAETERTGYLDLRLIPSSYTESWLVEPSATLGQIPIEAIRIY